MKTVNRAFDRFLGALLLIGAILGAGLAISGLSATWLVERPLVERLDTAFELLARTLNTSTNGLVVMNATLETSGEIMGMLETSMEEFSRSMENTIPLIENTGTLVGEDMTAVVRDTQTSLNAAQASARLVDDTLRLITSIPLIGRRYEPTMPLGESIAQVSVSLDGLPESFSEIQLGMTATATNLENIHDEIDTLNANIDEAQESLVEAEGIISEYQSQIKDLQERMVHFQTSLPTWLRGIKIGLTLLLVWLLIAQVGLILQGIQLLRRRPEPEI